MKQLMLLSLSLAPLFCLSQKIDENKYDKFDSLYTVKTKSETLTGGLMRSTYLSFVATKHKYLSLRFTKTPGEVGYSVLLTFKPQTTISLDESSEIKVEFADGKIVTYKNERSYHVYSSGDFAGVGIFVKADDPLFTGTVKSIRISSTSANDDFELKGKDQSVINKSLVLLKNTEFIKG